jgi:hypothetical protein
MVFRDPEYYIILYLVVVLLVTALISLREVFGPVLLG